ncbi:MAG TPA: DUF2249 domain-containing protein [Gemmatimonadaceae bacterium]
MPNPHLHLQADKLYLFDARGIAKRFRHAAIFGALDALVPGETMRFRNDHDPLPLLGQLRERYADRVAINYVSREPGEITIDFSVTQGHGAAKTSETRLP